MESHPQNPEFRNNPENFHPCVSKVTWFPVPFNKQVNGTMQVT